MDSAAKYIARLYEEAIARELDLSQIRSHLAARGVIRSAFQVKDDLDTVYCFAGYSASHPAPAVLSLKQIDAGIGY